MMRRSGFTLMELLLVISIIMLLAGMMMGSLNAARNYAAAARTHATIEKLNNIIMKKYASYQYRRVDIGDTDSLNPKEAAQKRLSALRILMRHEMPDRESDLSAFGSEELPAVTRYYNSVVTAAKKTTSGLTVNAQELLYLIVMSTPDGPSMLSEGELADTDGDGLLEIVDGWGRPIRFILWPAGFFVENYNADGDLQITTDTSSKQFVHDPFDVSNLHPDQPALYPLIYSAGPDGNYDVTPGKDGDNTMTKYTDDPFKSGKQGFLAGEPVNDDGNTATNSVGSLRHFDNIHNHSLNNN